MKEALFQESVIDASEAFIEKANLSNREIFKKAEQDPSQFWKDEASCIQWFKKPFLSLSSEPPFVKWYEDGVLNASYNCLDRHLDSSIAQKTALFWEGENGDQRTYSYQELYDEVNRLALVLKELGVKKKDRVAIYLPMIPEAIIAMQACARIGAIHTVVFAGFSSEALKDRILDAEASLLITADGGYRKGKITPLKAMADQALCFTPSIQNVLVIKRSFEKVAMQEGRDHFYDDLKQDGFCPPEPMDAEDPLFILYTSGTTGKPKGILHTTGGYMVGVTYTMRVVFDIKPDDIYFCTADVGWITGHSYMAYGPLSCGMTQLIYEGAPDYPDKDRFWQLVENYRVSILYTAPTAIRTFMKWGTQYPEAHDLSSLRLLGSVGEPINPEAWMWYYTHIGSSRCPIVDTWWQTETGSIMIAPIPGLTPLKPGSATQFLPGLRGAVLDDAGQAVSKGYLAITRPWPSMLRGIYKDPERFVKTYFDKWDSKTYFTGDGAIMDEEGYFWLMGRVDDVLNVSGHRLGTMELESALVDHPSVAEAAVIGIEHDIKGQAPVAFVTLKEGMASEGDLEGILKAHVSKIIGAIARPEKIYFTPHLPKTRSGKIMRRLLRDLASGRHIGDTSTLADPSTLMEIQKLYQED